MFKQTLVVLALAGLAFSAPQPRKLFHEHVEDFLDVIREEAGHDLEHLMEHYVEFEEFLQTLEYMSTTNFKDLVYELESLPEFVAVVEFLENDNIDIHFFIDLINEMLDNFSRKRSARHTISGKDFSSFIKDSISEFPKTKLAALYDQKISEDEAFRVAVENLQSEEWDAVFSALWESEVFQAEVKTLADNGLYVHVLLDEILAIFGQK